MECFVIISDPTREVHKESLDKRISEVFVNRYRLRGDIGWIVAHPEKTTTVQIWETIEEGQEEQLWGLVVKINEFRGYYDIGAWESLKTWGNYQ